MDVMEFDCGCEGTEAWEPIAFCPFHAGWMPAEPLYRCGECGFASVGFERLERHVYGEHLGAEVA